MRSVLLRASLAFGLLAGAMLASAQDAQAVYAKALPSVMTVNTVARDGKRYIGTAFLALREGVAITAWHVVDGAKEVTVRFSDGETYESTGLIDYDKVHDLALIAIKAKGRPQLTLAEQAPAVGSKLFVIGAPLGLDFSISDGIVSAIRKMNGITQYQFTAPTDHGNSGGPLLDVSGTVLGVMDSGFDGSDGLSFGIPISYLKELDTLAPTRPWATVTPAAGAPPTRASVPVKSAEEAEREDRITAGKLLPIRVAVAGYYEAMYDINPAIAKKPFRAPQSIAVAAAGLRKAAEEMHELRFNDAEIEAVVRKAERNYAEGAAIFQKIKESLNESENGTQTGQSNNRLKEAYAEYDVQTGSGWETIEERLRSLTPESSKAKFPKDAVAAIMGPDRENLVMGYGLLLSLNSLPSCVVMEVDPRSPADKAGFRPYDLILTVEGETVTDWTSLKALLVKYAKRNVRVRVERGSSTKELRMKL